MTFAFDEQFAMFDITPVENQFILEYMPGARGEFVKVYLYGLLCCYHPKEEMDLGSMSRELGMTEEEILSAFRYWERRGILRRVSDRPPQWQYINIKQKELMGGDTPVDPDYVAFSRELENSFDGIRVFHGSETAACYEWKEGNMQLSTEVIVMLLKHMYRTRGKSFKIKDAEKVALRLAEENARTPDEAAEILSRDEAATAGFRKILRKLGKRYAPSDANMALYRKWTVEWMFTQEAVEFACDLMEKSDPSLSVLDAILENARTEAGSKRGFLTAEDVEKAEERRKGLQRVMKEAGQFGAATPAQKKQYQEMLALYPQEIILIAARECARKGRHFDSILKLLQSWQERGFTQEEEIRAHIRAFHEKEAFLKGLKEKWSGRESEIGQKTLEMLERWEGLGLSREMITLAADSAFEVKKPMAYMDKILGYWAENNIRTVEEAKRDRQKSGEAYQEMTRKSGGKAVGAQQYEQRDYSGEQDEALRRMISMMGGNEDA